MFRVNLSSLNTPVSGYDPLQITEESSDQRGFLSRFCCKFTFENLLEEKEVGQCVSAVFSCFACFISIWVLKFESNTVQNKGFVFTKISRILAKTIAKLNFGQYLCFFVFCMYVKNENVVISASRLDRTVLSVFLACK